MSRIRLLPALLAPVLLTGCVVSDPGAKPEEPASSGAEGAAQEPAAQEPAAVALVPFRYGPRKVWGRGTRLAGCGSIGDAPAAYETPVLVQARLRVSERTRLLPATYAERSNAIDSVTQYLGPHPGPAAPHMAVSQGVGPTSDRLSYDTRLIGDARDSPAGLAGAQRSWEQRVPLDRPRVVAPGDHYLFVEVDPATGGMDLHELTARWDGGEQEIGGFSLRVLCGG
ncbi:hypothetical protein GCM10027270_34560 [Nocardioides ginkgobilobae]